MKSELKKTLEERTFERDRALERVRELNEQLNTSRELTEQIRKSENIFRRNAYELEKDNTKLKNIITVMCKQLEAIETLSKFRVDDIREK